MLRLRQRAHVDSMLFQPTRDGVGIAPFVLSFTINLRDLHGAELLFDILLVKPVSVLVERFMT